MGTLSADQARELLGGPARLNGHDVLAGHANQRGTVLISRPRDYWPWLSRRRGRQPGETRPGSRLIAAGTALLFAVMAGLLGVSYAAQYSYVLGQRHQHVASLIEAGALDVLLIIFSLLALGLARAGLPAKTERALVVVFACGSALMNYAAADVSSPRSVAAYVMPPIALAIVVDRCVAATRRHVLGMRDGRSPWAVAGTAATRAARFAGLSVLYVLRFLVDRKGTSAGIRAAILNATPLPVLDAVTDGDQAEDPKPGRDRRERRRGDGRRRQRRTGLSKKAALLELYRQHEGYGDRSRVAPIADELAPRAGLQAGTARTYLGEAVRQLEAGAS
jgi:hypothetical protein